jgi:hypothetical protein
MNIFFTTIALIDAFTLSLDCHTSTLQCQQCLKTGQFVSHGFIYKQRSLSVKEPVGKRILCSNRYGRSGCGRTVQLYIASELPSFRYGTAHLFVFLSSLLANFSVKQSYQKATRQPESRNAWRWLNALTHKLIHYRSVLRVRLKTVSNQYLSRIRRLQILLPTVERLFAKMNNCPCSNYQLITQRPFM